jgi:integrase
MRCGCGGKVERKRCASCGGEGHSSWYYRVDTGARNGQRQRRTKGGFATKSEALAAMATLQKDVADGTHVEGSRQTVGQYLDGWLAGVTVRGSTYNSYALAVRRLLPHIGTTTLQALTRAEIRAAYKAIGDGGRSTKGNKKGGALADKTVHNTHLALVKALGAAVEDRKLTFNPAQAAHRLVKDRPEMKTWLASELRAFLGQIQELPTVPLPSTGPRADVFYSYPLWRLAAYTGMRRGEVLGLRWRDVDLDAARLSVRQQVARIRRKGADGKVEVIWGYGPPKTKAGKRSIALDRGSVDVLRDRRQMWATEKVKAGQVYKDEDLVFCKVDGSRLDPDVVSSIFERLVRKSGLPRIRFHDLRHTHATLGLAAGIHPKVMSERLGHSSITITLDLYSHAIPALGADAADRIAAVVDGF